MCFFSEVQKEGGKSKSNMKSKKKWGEAKLDEDMKAIRTRETFHSEYKCILLSVLNYNWTTLFYSRGWMQIWSQIRCELDANMKANRCELGRWVDAKLEKNWNQSKKLLLKRVPNRGNCEFLYRKVRKTSITPPFWKDEFLTGIVK